MTEGVAEMTKGSTEMTTGGAEMRRGVAEMRTGEAAMEILEAAEAVAFVEAAAAGAFGEDLVGEVFEFAAASAAAVDVSKGEALATLPPPFEEEPRSEDAGEHRTEADEDEDAEGNPDHGRDLRVGVLSSGAFSW